MATNKGKLLPIKSFLLRLDPEVRAMALKNFELYPTGLSHTKVYKLSDALKLAFWWRNTPEGKDRWAVFHSTIKLQELNQSK